MDPHLPKENPRPSVPGKQRKVCVQSNVMVNITTMRINLIFPQLLLKVLFFLSADNPGTTVIDEDEGDLQFSSYNARLSRLREKHGKFPEFKLQCWARMLVRNIKFSARH